MATNSSSRRLLQNLEMVFLHIVFRVPRQPPKFSHQTLHLARGLGGDLLEYCHESFGADGTIQKYRPKWEDLILLGLL